MNKSLKVIIFIIIVFAVVLIGTVIKEESGLGVLGVGAIFIIFLYSAMFNKPKEKEKD